eukprot:3797599-Amphidinium_carterae.1
MLSVHSQQSQKAFKVTLVSIGGMFKWACPKSKTALGATSHGSNFVRQPWVVVSTPHNGRLRGHAVLTCKPGAVGLVQSQSNHGGDYTVSGKEGRDLSLASHLSDVVVVVIGISVSDIKVCTGVR